MTSEERYHNGNTHPMNGTLYTVYSIIKLVAFVITLIINLTAGINRVILAIRASRVQTEHNEKE